MTQSKGGRRSRRGIYLGAVAALAVTLSACGGGSGNTSADAAAAQSSEPAQSATPTTTQGSTSASSASTDSSNSGSGTTTGTDSTGNTPPTASATSVTLNWMPPTENVDGSALTNLAGYDIHYGTTSGKYTQKVAVSNPGLATYVVTNLTPGTYYFSVAAVNSDGTESPLSSEVSATVN